MITYGVISWLIPKTYSTTLDASLDSAVNSLLTEVENLTPMESGNLFDEFVINQNGVLIQLFDSLNREIELEHSRNKKTGGSGLGLYIVKTILEQHQAEYSITNTERGVCM